MNDSELDMMLNTLQQETYPKEKFPSPGEFKKKFFKTVGVPEADKKQQENQTSNEAESWTVDFKSAAESHSCSKRGLVEYIIVGLCASVAVVISVAIFDPFSDTLSVMSSAMVENGVAQECGMCRSRRAAGGQCAPNPSSSRAQYDVVGGGISHHTGRAFTETSFTPAVTVQKETVTYEAPKYNTEEYKSYEENPFLEVRTNPLSTFGADVDTASYTNLRRILRSGVHPNRDAVRTEELLNYFSYNYPAPENGEKFAVHFEMMNAPWNTSHKLLLVGVQAKKMDMKQLPPSNFVFLIDNSGSMFPHMGLVRESMSRLADTMRPLDTISIVTYGGGVDTLLSGVSGRNKRLIKNVIEHIAAGGYTPGGAGIQRAYQLAHQYFIRGGNNRIILITDGDFNVGASSESALTAMVEKERQSAIYLTAIGVGSGNYKDNKLKMLANKGNGNYMYWDSIQEARYSLVNEMAGKMFTLAKDVKFQLEMNPAKIHSYRQIGYEMRQLAARDFNDDTKDSGEVGMGQQVTVLYELVMADGENGSGVDPLKYQEVKSGSSSELLTCKLRYQEPEGNAASVKKTFVLSSIPEAGNNICWAASVAEFALIMRDSAYKGNANLTTLRQRAQKHLGDDKGGKRVDFLSMIRDAAGNSPAPRAANAACSMDGHTSCKQSRAGDMHSTHTRTSVDECDHNIHK